MLATRDRERAEDAALQDREREPPEDAALQSEADLTKDIENDMTKKTEGTDLTEQETTQEKETDKAASSSITPKPEAKKRKHKKAGK